MKINILKILILVVLGSNQGRSEFGLETIKTSSRSILFFGNSITAGYGVGREKAFPAHIQSRIDSTGWNFHVVNAGLSGETSAAGVRRIDWVLRQPVDVFVHELGGNDGLRGLPLEQTEQNLSDILSRVRAKNNKTELVIAGMQLPPNLGPVYTNNFQTIFPRLAQDSGALLIPFLLEGVGGNKNLMSKDGIHPNTAGHEEIASIVWTTLAPLLAKMSTDSVDLPQNRKGRGQVHPTTPEHSDQNGD